MSHTGDHASLDGGTDLRVMSASSSTMIVEATVEYDPHTHPPLEGGQMWDQTSMRTLNKLSSSFAVTRERYSLVTARYRHLI
jgi:hypothetical protein